MEVVKKNIVSIICGVIALAAVIVTFTFVSGKISELQTNLDARRGTYEQLHGLLSKPRELPIVDPDNPTAAKLDKFPSEFIIKQGEGVVTAMQSESTAMSAAAVAMNTHKLLVPLSLPAPASVAAFQFRTQYQQYYPQAAGNNPGGAPAVPAGGNGQPIATNAPFLGTELAKALNAGMPPTADEIRVALETEINTIKQKMLIVQGGNNPINGPAVEAAIRDKQLKLPNQIKMRVATTSKVYISPDTFDVYPKIAG